MKILFTIINTEFGITIGLSNKKPLNEKHLIDPTPNLYFYFIDILVNFF